MRTGIQALPYQGNSEAGGIPWLWLRDYHITWQVQARGSERPSALFPWQWWTQRPCHVAFLGMAEERKNCSWCSSRNGPTPLLTASIRKALLFIGIPSLFSCTFWLKKFNYSIVFLSLNFVDCLSVVFQFHISFRFKIESFPSWALFCISTPRHLMLIEAIAGCSLEPLIK